MQFVTGLKCVCCDRVFSTRVPYTCPRCGITGILDVQYDYAAIRRRLTWKALAKRALTHWRYGELIPVSARAVRPNLAVGWTPVVQSSALAKHLGIRTLYLKDDGRNPTGSFKDRASSVGVTLALEKRRKVIACASTGNAASSLAGMAASVSLRSAIFVPQQAPEPKVTQLLIFGATVFRVRGSYAAAYDLCQQACERWGWYNRNCAVNPYLVEGKKTCGLEICEQLGWQPPDWVVVSVGDGCTIAGTWKAFREMKTLGLIRRTPKMLGVQAEGAAPVTAAFRTGSVLQPVEPKTLADSIAVGVPRNWKKAVNAVGESGGAMINVSDEEILEAMRFTGRLSGIFAEPAAAAAVAGLRRALADGVVPQSASALVVITGSGLKDIRSAVTAVSPPHEVLPDMDQLAALVKEHGLAT
ncbi:MAG TPA: threonine synthase [Candidatus Acidoferrales bacterium]|nr:threonine synthase [Candidatus Acidoferrales bacterium]